MKRLLFVAAIAIGFTAALQACSQGSTQSSSACNFVQNGDHQRVSWGSQLPVVMWVDNSVPNQYYQSIVDAADSWNQTLGREVIKVGGWTKTNGVPAQDGQNVIYYLHHWEQNRSNEQGRTTVYWSGNQIYEADVRVDAQNFDFSGGVTPGPNQVDFQSLMTHEFGHVLGLVHSDDTGSVMAKSLPSATLRRNLAQIDQESIRCEY